MDVAERSWSELDGILDVVEPMLLIGAAERRVREPQVERWRWDEPALALTWTERVHGGLSKNVRFTIDNDHAPFHCSIEVNAWRDISENDRALRLWNHQVIDEIKVNSAFEAEREADRLRGAVTKAYNVITEWNEESLDRTHVLRCR